MTKILLLVLLVSWLVVVVEPRRRQRQQPQRTLVHHHPQTRRDEQALMYKTQQQQQQTLLKQRTHTLDRQHHTSDQPYDHDAFEKLSLDERWKQHPGVPPQISRHITMTQNIVLATSMISVYADPAHLNTFADTLYSLLFQTQRTRIILVSIGPDSPYTEGERFQIMLKLRNRKVKEKYLGKIYWIETAREWGPSAKLLGGLQLISYIAEKRVFWNGDSLLVWEWQPGWEKVERRVKQYKSSFLFSLSRPPHPVPPGPSTPNPPPPPPSVFERIIVCESGVIYPPTFVQTLLEASLEEPEVAIGFQGWRVLPTFQYSPPLPLSFSLPGPPSPARVHLIDGKQIKNEFPVAVLTGEGGFVVKSTFFGNYSMKKMGASVKDAKAEGPMGANVWASGELAKNGVMKVVTPYVGSGKWERVGGEGGESEDQVTEVVARYGGLWEKDKEKNLFDAKVEPDVTFEVKVARLVRAIFGGWALWIL